MEDIIIILIIALAVICVLGLCYWFFTKKLNIKIFVKKPQKEKKPKPKKEKKPKQDMGIKNFNIVLIDKFMDRKDLLFWKYLNTILPRSFVAVPKVALVSIINPDGNKILYNDVMDKTIDIVVFDEQKMQPVLAIDVYDNSFGDMRMDEEDPKLFEIVTRLNLKIVHIFMNTKFDKNLAKKSIYEKLNISMPDEE